MKTQSFEHLNNFFKRVQSIGFFERIFAWKNVVRLNYDAYSEFKAIDKQLTDLNEELDKSISNTKGLQKDIQHQKEIQEKSDHDLEISKSTIERNNKEIQEKEKELGKLKESDNKNSKRILELESELEMLKSTIERNNKEIQEKEKELGKLKESDNKNSKRIIELESELETLKSTIERNNKEIQEREKGIGKLKESDNKNNKRILELESETEKLKYKNEDITTKKTDAEKKLAENEKVKKKEQEEYEHKITKLNTLTEQVDDTLRRIQEERKKEITTKFNEMKDTWKNHETKIEHTIKSICKVNQIEYLNKEKIPFKGKPDNTIKICDEYIIFDAKSPQSDDLKNFPKYIKNQAESIKKYTKEKCVKKDIFLVIPSNTADSIKEYYYNMADYNVFIVTVDSLEPIILSLRKIEDYEFVEQLSPEDRENICRIIGKFAHATKRRIQIDSYFCNEFISILTQCNTLPQDILDKALEFEKSDKMNPPIEKRAKRISNDELKRDIKRIKQESEAKDIDTKSNLEDIEKIPLYSKKKN